MRVFTTSALEDPRDVRATYPRLEEIGYDGVFSFEAKHDPFVALGLGSRLYDSRLALVAANPSAPVAASAPIASGARLYALTRRCTAAGPVLGAVAVAARTGEVLARRRGAFVLGPLGGAVSESAEDPCD